MAREPPCSVRIRVNADQTKLRIWTYFWHFDEPFFREVHLNKFV